MAGNSTTAPVMRARGLTYSYAGAPRPAVRGVDLEIAEGEVLALAGPNGCGKSTLLALMFGALEPQSGDVLLGAKRLGEYGASEVARIIAVLPQSEAPTPNLSGYEMALLGRTPHFQGLLGLATEEDERIARESLARVGAAAFATRDLGTLSGGERQLVLLARALAQQPRVLLLDEPSASLDLAHQQQVFRLLRQIAREDRVAVIVATHDLNLAAVFADRVALMREGSIVACGAPAEVLREDAVREIYAADVWASHSPEGHVLIGLRA